MKNYIKQALKELINSDKTKISIDLKSKNDYKKNPLKLLYNRFIFLIQTRIVPSHIKNFILRTTGMKVGHDVCFPHYIKIDPYFPELITLEKGCLVGGDSKLVTHKIIGNKLTLGKIIIKERAMVGGVVTMNPGTVLNKNSMISLYSETDSEIPEGEVWAGKPAKLLSKLSPEDIDKYFKPSDGNYRQYYKDFRKKVKDFLADPKQTFFKIYYNGKRLNAGDDWWRARNFFRIWYNGIIIELTRLLPHSWFKTMLYKMVGVKIGKNVRIGKGTVLDHIYCDNITIEDNVTIDENCYLDGHEYTITQTVFGKSLLKTGVHLKNHSFVRIGTTIGENTVVEPYTMAQREVPPNVVIEGVPWKVVRELKSN
jgi:acetyltransferase-like isoleucine patch superfamily enzyme